MSTGPHAYRDLNNHHAEIDGKAAQVPDRQRERADQEADAPSQTQEQQQHSDSFTAYLDGFQERYGKDAHITPEHEAAARKTLGKDLPPGYMKEELADIIKTHGTIEQDRQFRLQREADQARDADRPTERQTHSGPQSGYNSLVAEQERKDRERQERIEARVNQHLADRNAARERRQENKR